MHYLPSFIIPPRKSRKKPALGGKIMTIFRRISVSQMIVSLLLFGLIFSLTILPAQMLAVSGQIAAWAGAILLTGFAAWGITRLSIAVFKFSCTAIETLKGIGDTCAQTSAIKDQKMLLVDNDKLKSAGLRGAETIFSFSIWVLFINLLQPVATALMWWLGVRLFDEKIYSVNTTENILKMMGASGEIAFITFLILFAWQQWNYQRYGKLERRKPRPTVNTIELAMLYGVSPDIIRQAQSFKIASVAVCGNQVRFTDKAPDLKAVKTLCLMLLLLMLPVQVWAANATFQLPVTALGYDQDLVVNGAKNNLSLQFPLPSFALAPGSMVKLTVEPGRNLNDYSSFSFSLNGKLAASFTAGQLKANPHVQLPIPPEAVPQGRVQVDILSNVFASDDICRDYQRGFLVYTVRNSSAMTINYTPAYPRNVPEFFTHFTTGLLVVLPDNPSLAEVAAGSWVYGLMQKQYAWLPVKLIMEKERAAYPGLPRIQVALHEHLPPALANYDQGMYLAAPDLLLVTAQTGDDLKNVAKQISELAVLKSVPGNAINIGLKQQSDEKPPDKIYFGNEKAQEGIASVPIDFHLYPGLLPIAPKSIKLHLDGRYDVSTVANQSVKMDVYLNRTLIHSESLNNSGVLNKEISLPSSVRLNSHNLLNIEFIYPDEMAKCKVYGTVQGAQIFTTSYFSEEDHLASDDYDWSNIGMLFNKQGLILTGSNLTSDTIKAVGEAVQLMNRQLPPGVYAFPDVESSDNFSMSSKPNYLLALATVEELGENLQKALPLEINKEYTIFRKEDKSVIYRYQPNSNVVVGQIGNYKGVPLISFSANIHQALLPVVLRQLQQDKVYNPLSGNILVMSETGAITSADSHSSIRVVRTNALSAWVDELWLTIAFFVEEYKRPLISATVILGLLGAAKYFLTRKKKGNRR